MKKIILLISIMALSIVSQAQYEGAIKVIAEAPSTYTADAVLLRMIEGAGFRYYWVSEGMKDTDMAVEPCEDCRSTFETIEHIYNLSAMVRSTVMGEVFDRSKLLKSQSFHEYVAASNANWAEAANYLRSNARDISRMEIDFGNDSKVPFWNLLNGPLADAIYHSGQIVTLRRMSGNPINPKVNVFMGKLND